MITLLKISMNKQGHNFHLQHTPVTKIEHSHTTHKKEFYAATMQFSNWTNPPSNVRTRSQIKAYIRIHTFKTFLKWKYTLQCSSFMIGCCLPPFWFLCRKTFFALTSVVCSHSSSNTTLDLHPVPHTSPNTPPTSFSSWLSIHLLA